MNDNRMKDALENIARRGVPENTNLWPNIAARLERKTFMQTLRTRPVWFIVLVVLALMAFTGVAYAIGNMLGYIPGVGLVDQNTSIRVLAEPVKVTRDGVTVAVTQAFITDDKTSIYIETAGVPQSAYPVSESVTGCLQMEYLRLPDGTKMNVVANMPALPKDVNEVTLFVPCIFNTLPGTVPENWVLPLRFVPAPPDMTVIPVTEILSSPSPQADEPSVPENPLAVTKVLEIGEHLVIMGEFRYAALEGFAHDNVASDGSVWCVKSARIADANGQQIPNRPSNDIEWPSPSQPGVEVWVFEIDKNFIPPLTISYEVEHISPVGTAEQAKFEFDAGQNPRAGSQWVMNEDFIMGGYNIRLVSITSGSQGYSFHFKADPGTGANWISVDLLGYTPNCGGGGGGEDYPDEFDSSFCFSDFGNNEFPKGNLTAIINFQAISREDKTFQIEWNPGITQTSTFAPSTPQPGVCLTHNTLPQLAQAPATLTGRALIYELMEDGQTWGLSIVNLDGSQKQELVPQGSWGALSPDGTRIAFPWEDGIKIIEIATGTSTILKDAMGYDLHWSPDGTQIAFAGGGGDKIGVFVIATDGTPARQLTSEGYEAFASWSPDNRLVYITVRDIGGWMLRTIAVTSGTSQNLFILDNASAKAPYAAVSPDGKWVAYRDRELSSLYLVRTDGTDGHVVMENPALAISSIVWSQDGKWLGVSLANFDSEARTVVLLQPESCQAYLLPEIHGEIEGLHLP